MGAADTAKLLASLDLQDAMSPKLKSAIGNVANTESAVGRLGTKLSGFASNLRGGIGGALTTFSGRVKQMGGALLGLLGIGGIFGVGKVLTDSISKAEAFGDAAFRLSKIIGGTITQAGKLIDALDYFGVTAETQISIANKFEKAIGALTLVNAKGAKAVAEYNKTHRVNLSLAKTEALLYPAAIKFYKDYGLSILDVKGKIRDYNAQLLVSADYFNNKAIPASQKAAALAKLYGKTWTDLIPVLAQGSAGIKKAEAEAITLTQAQLDSITKNKEATRAWTDAISDLETEIGINLLPTLTDLLKTGTSFIEAHSQDIIDYVNRIVDFGKSAVSTLAGAVEEVSGLWNKIPAPLRDFLVKFAVGERIIKFLFGFSPVELVLKVGEEALAKIVGGVAGGVAKVLGQTAASKIIPQHVWVDNPNFGGGGNPIVPAAEGAAAGEGAAALGGITGAMEAFVGGSALSIFGGLAAAAAVTFIVGAGLARILHDAGVPGALDPTAPTRNTRGDGTGTAVPPGTDIRHYGATTSGAGAMSLEDRTLREPLIAANAKLQAIKDAAQTTKTDAARYAANAKIDMARLRQALAYRMDMSNSKLEAIKDKDQSVHVTIGRQTSYFRIVSYGSNESGRTVQKVVQRGGDFVIS